MKKFFFSLNICFHIILLFYRLNLINSFCFFPLKEAKEEISLNNTNLIFSIKGAVDSSFKEDINFLIESEFYKDNELLSNKKYVNCKIQKSPKAVFGTQINALCEFDLLYEPTSNKILFSKFISDTNMVKIDDPNNFILGKNLSFSKIINITQNYEFNIEGLKSINCFQNNYTFGIIGEIDKIFVSSFTFNLTINPSSPIKAQCKSPYIYFTRKTMINCTINILNNDTDFINNLNKGIEIKENYYRVINEEGEKILKIKIGNQNEKMELNNYNCSDENQVNNEKEIENKSDKNKTKDINEESKNILINETDIRDNEDINKTRDNKDIIDYNKNKDDNNITKPYNNNSVIEGDNIIDISDEKNNTELMDVKEKNEIDNNTTSENIKIDINITKHNITIINKTKNNEIENNDDINEYNKTENINEDYNIIKNITKNNNLTNNLTDFIEIINEKNESKNYSINNESNIMTELKEENNITNEKNESNIENKNISIAINNSIKDNEKEMKKSDNIYKNNSIENETQFKNFNYSNHTDIENINNSIYSDIENSTNNNNISYNQENNNTNKTIDKNTEKSDSRDIRGDELAQIWRLFGKGNRDNNINNKTEMEKEEEKQREWEKKKEEEKKKKKEEEEKDKEEIRKRREQEEMVKMIREREEKERKEKAEKERKEKEEKEKMEKEQEEKKRRENLRNRDRNYENNNNENDDKNKNNNNDLNISNNLDIKLIHVQFRYSLGNIFYMFYSLTSIPKGHKIKINLSISKYNKMGFNIEDKNIILTTNEEINTSDKNIVIEYKGSLECKDCKKIILKNDNIEGATIYKIPEEKYLRDAIFVNKNNYISRYDIKSPLLYITEEISNKDCMVYLQGHFFNNNKFFISQFNLVLINKGNPQIKNNITVSCSLNERSIFTCPIKEQINRYDYELEQFIIDKKENIIIDNSLILKNNKINYVTCENKKINNKNDKIVDNKLKNNEKVDVKKKSKKKKIIISLICLVLLLYLIITCCCYEEPEYNYSPSSGAISSSNYVGETSVLMSRRW